MVVIIPNQLRIMSNGGGCGDYILNLLPLNSLKAASAAAVDCVVCGGEWIYYMGSRIESIHKGI